MAANLLVAQVRTQPGAVVIDLKGEINSSSEEVLNDALGRAENISAPAILLNFAQVDYINSTGIALIVGLLVRARESGRRVLASGLSQHYEEIFQITRLSDFIGIYPSEVAALEALEPAEA